MFKIHNFVNFKMQPGEVQELLILVVGFTNRLKKYWEIILFLLQNLGVAKFALIQIPNIPHGQIPFECTNFPQLIPLSSSMSCFQVNAKCQFLEGIRYTAEAYVLKWNCQLRCTCQISRRLSRDNKIASASASASETSNIYDKTLGDVVVVSHHAGVVLVTIY